MTHRYLLFDSGCAVCTRLAEEIEHESDGWLIARSLRNPEMQALLDTARPGWRWEPTLLEVQDGRPRVFTGVAMRARMALGLGPRRAWRVFSLVNRIELPVSTFTSERRTFLRRGATLASIVLGIGVTGDALFAQTEEPPAPRIKRMSKDDPKVQKLKDSPTGRLASRLHGSAVWNDVQEIIDPVTWQTGYLVPFQKSEQEARYLFAGNPMEGKEAAAIVLSIKKENDATLLYTLMTIAGAVVQQARTHKGQVVSRQNYQVTEAITPNVSQSQQSFLDCLRGCVRTLGLNLGPACVGGCAFCATLPSPYNPGCYVCAACIGGGAFFCILNCWTYT